MTSVLALLAFSVAVTLASGGAAILWARFGQGGGRIRDNALSYDIRTW